MCGRVTQYFTREKLVADMGGLRTSVPLTLLSRYNITPTEELYVVRGGKYAHGGGSYDLALDAMRWGVTAPHGWPRRGEILFNAKRETFLERPSGFWREGGWSRCVIPVNGFYEWTGGKKARIPWYFTHSDTEREPLLYLAGLSRLEHMGDVYRNVVVIMTTEAEGSVASYHARMPIMLTERWWQIWLGEDTASVFRLLHISERFLSVLAVRQVSSRVNNARNKGPDVLDPP